MRDGTEVLRLCAFGSKGGECEKPWSDAIVHGHMVPYQCSEPHEPYEGCHRYVCPTHGRGADIDEASSSACGRCIIDELRRLLREGS